jgi:hypothetical protein
MMTRKFTAATLATTAVALTALLLAYPALVAPAAAATNPNTSTAGSAPKTSMTGGDPGGLGPQGPMGPGGQGPTTVYGPGQGQKVSVTDGQTFTVTSTTGHYVVVGDSTDNGTASGTVTFTVTSSLSAGDALSISGTIVVGGTTYTISSGSAEMSPSATAISGQGTTSPTGNFLLQASAHGSFVGSSGQVSLDLSNGTTEYLVFLNGTVTG